MTVSNLPAQFKDVPLGPPIKPGKNGRRAYLKGWELDFAEWYTRQPIRPALAEQVEKARELTQTLIGEKYLTALKQRPKWKDLVTKLNTDQMTRAKYLFEARAPKAVQSHFQAIDELMKAGDYKSIAPLTTPVLDRVMPKKQDGAPVTAISITLHQGQVEALDAEFVDITAVKLPRKTDG